MIKKWAIAFGIMTASCISFLGMFWVFLQIYVRYGTWVYSAVSVMAVLVGSFFIAKKLNISR